MRDYVAEVPLESWGFTEECYRYATVSDTELYLVSDTELHLVSDTKFIFVPDPHLTV